MLMTRQIAMFEFVPSVMHSLESVQLLLLSKIRRICPMKLLSYLRSDSIPISHAEFSIVTRPPFENFLKEQSCFRQHYDI